MRAEYQLTHSILAVNHSFVSAWQFTLLPAETEDLPVQRPRYPVGHRTAGDYGLDLYLALKLEIYIGVSWDGLPGAT